MDNETIKKVNPEAPVMKDRLTREDKDIIRGAFRDEWVTLTIIRDLFFGFKLSEWEKSVVTSMKPEVKRVLRKVIIPSLSRENPIGSSNSSDLWSSVNILEATPEQQKQRLAARYILLQMLEQAFGLLDEPSKEPVDFSVDFSVDKQTPIDRIIARNTFINYIEQQLVLLNVLAYSKQETPEEKKERIKKDSAK